MLRYSRLCIYTHGALTDTHPYIAIPKDTSLALFKTKTQKNYNIQYKIQSFKGLFELFIEDTRTPLENYLNLRQRKECALPNVGSTVNACVGRTLNMTPNEDSGFSASFI